MGTTPPGSRNDGPAKRAIVECVTSAAAEGSPGYVPPMGRVAVFGNDGIRWVEKPAPVQTAFVLGGLTERSGSMVRVKKDWNAVHTVRPTQEEASASRQ